MSKFNPFGLFGETDTQFQQKVANQQSGQYNQLMQQQLANQQGLSNAAGGLYGNLAQIGAQDRNLYGANLGPLFNLLAQTAGVPYSLQGGQGPPTMRGARNDAAMQGMTSQNPARTITPNLSREGLGTSEQRQRDPGGGNGYPGATIVPNTATSGVAGQQNLTDFWGLTGPQQIQQNKQLEALSQSEAASMQDYRQSYLARGMSPPPEGEAMIRQHYSSQALDLQAQFAETARMNRQNVTEQMLNMIMGIGAEGTQATGQAAAGIGGLAGQAGSLASNLGGLSQGSMGQAMNAAQSTQGSQDALLTGLFELGGAALGGLFGSPKITVNTTGTPPFMGDVLSGGMARGLG